MECPSRRRWSAAPPASGWRCGGGGDHQWAVRAADGERRAALLLLSDVPHRHNSSSRWCSYTPHHHLRHAGVYGARVRLCAGGDPQRPDLHERWDVTGFKHKDTQCDQVVASSHGDKAVLKTVFSRRVVGCPTGTQALLLWADQRRLAGLTESNRTRGG